MTRVVLSPIALVACFTMLASASAAELAGTAPAGLAGAVPTSGGSVPAVQTSPRCSRRRSAMLRYQAVAKLVMIL